MAVQAAFFYNIGMIRFGFSFLIVICVVLLGLSCDLLSFGKSPEDKKLEEAIYKKIQEGGLGALQVKVTANAKTGVVELEAQLGNARQEKQIIDLVKSVPGVTEVKPKFTFTDADSGSGLIQDGTTGLGGGIF